MLMMVMTVMTVVTKTAMTRFWVIGFFLASGKIIFFTREPKLRLEGKDEGIRLINTVGRWYGDRELERWLRLTEK